MLSISVNKNSNHIFQCQMCGICCKGYGGTFINDKDIIKISRFINVSYDTFVSNYTQFSGSKRILIQKKNGFCVFWNKKNACLIHSVKPNMCKQWPFIKSVLIDINNWKIMASCCSGIRTDVDDDEIIMYVKKQIQNSV